MEKEQRKEVLTREIIKKEIKYISICNILFRLIPTIILIPLILFIRHLSLELNETKLDVNIFIIILFFPILFIFIGDTCCLLKFLITAHNKKFLVTMDKLSNATYKIEPNNPYRSDSKYALFPIGLFLSNGNYYLFFSKKRKWQIPIGCIYTWSKYNCMNDHSVFRSSNIGDEFYLVIIGKKIIIAYNTKLFELKD